MNCAVDISGVASGSGTTSYEISEKMSSSIEKESRDDMYFDSDYHKKDDLDLRNSEVVIQKFHQDPYKCMKLLTYDDSPMAKAANDIVIRIEASTVSLSDCKMRAGTYEWAFREKPSLPIVPGIDCVGVIISCGENARKNGIEPGDRVAALMMGGCHAKYRTMAYNDVVKISDSVDAGKAVSVIRAYGAAFQVLMTGKTGHSRYQRKPLNGKKVLVAGPMGNFERAVVELAIAFGAKKVYFACTQSQDNYIRLLGAKPLQGRAEEWVKEVRGKIDIAIDGVCDDRYEHSFASLNNNGILVATGMSEIEKNVDIISSIEKVWTHATVALYTSCSYYSGFIDSYKNNKVLCMKDLIYLFNLLDQGKIDPKIATRIPLSKVPHAHTRFESNPASADRRGIIVVEPWKRFVD